MVESQGSGLKSGLKILISILFYGFVTSAQSYVLTESTLRVPIRWNSSNLEINFDTSSNDSDPRNNIFCRSLSSELQNTCSLRASTDVNEVLSLWNQHSPVKISSNPFSSNRLTFSQDPRFFSPGVVAVTMLSYNPGDGVIKNGQIYVNQQMNPGFCFTQSKSALGCVYLGDVIAHELGHFAGLAHSEVREGTMLYASFRGQHSLHADDLAGLRAIYQSTSHGRIRGRVMGGSRVPVFGAHVQAISSKGGDVVASAISQENGEFVIQGLDLNDTYYLYTEPLKKLDSLPDAYRSVQNSFCPGSYVGSFFESCSSQMRGQPLAIRLSNQTKEIDVGIVSIRCHLRVSPNYLEEKLRTGQGLYEFTAQQSRPMTSFVGFYPQTESIPFNRPHRQKRDEIKLDLSQLGDLPLGSNLVVKLISTSIGSAIDFRVKIDGPTGSRVDPDRLQVDPNDESIYSLPNIEPFTLKPIFQRKILYPLSSSGDQNFLEISFSPRALNSQERVMVMPSGNLFTIKDYPYLVMFEIQRGSEILFSDVGRALSDNSSCLDAPFTFPVKANNVSSASIAGQQDDQSTSQVAGASCGTIEPPKGSGGSGPMSFLLGLMLLAFFPPKIRSKNL